MRLVNEKREFAKNVSWSCATGTVGNAVDTASVEVVEVAISSTDSRLCKGISVVKGQVFGKHCHWVRQQRRNMFAKEKTWRSTMTPVLGSWNLWDFGRSLEKPR